VSVQTARGARTWAAWLEHIAGRPVSYAGATVAAIAADLAAQAGFDLAAVVDAQPQFSVTTVTFALQLAAGANATSDTGGARGRGRRRLRVGRAWSASTPGRK
jgi:hypothetical protein